MSGDAGRSDLDPALQAALDAAQRTNRSWVQVELAAQPGAQQLAAAVAPLWPPLGARRWWFVRKQPGVRVRVEAGPDGGDHDEVAQALRAGLERLGAATVSVYEAEQFRFGAAAGMDVAHDLFSFDSALAALRERASYAAVTAPQWSAMVLGDLIDRLVDDPAERWDAWKRLEDLLLHIGVAAPAEPAVEGPPLPAALGPVLAQGHGRVAGRLRAVELGHGVGRRSWFAAAAVFHWNRLGFEPTQMAAVVAGTLARLGPPR